MCLCTPAEGCSKRFHSLAMSQRSWPLSQDANKNSGVCSGCRTVRQLHLKDGKVHRRTVHRCPHDNPCPGSHSAFRLIYPALQVHHLSHNQSRSRQMRRQRLSLHPLSARLLILHLPLSGIHFISH